MLEGKTSDRIQDAPNVEETLRRMKVRLGRLVPEFELEAKAELAFRINQVKRERNAIVLGHNYMEPALFHSVPDYTGDSLALAAVSAKTNADVIVFCGVQFMAETAKILNPGKTVLIPAERAGCSLAEGITVEDVKRLRVLYPKAPVVTYVNTYAAVKAESDYCCTSGNSSAILRHLFAQGHETVVFLPDEYLARNTAGEMGVAYVGADLSVGDMPENAGLVPGQRCIVGWRTRCEVHELFTVRDVENIRRQYPNVAILAHPECSPDVIALVDYVGSTKGMIDYVRDVNAPRYALLTECTMGDNVAAEFPNRELVRACSLRCKHMNLITLESTLESLIESRYAVDLPPDVIERARTPIDRMLAIR